MKKSVTTQELVNIYPKWARVRDEQSVGYGFLNSMAQPMERMDKSLKRMRSNQYLLTANLDEVDLLHKVVLPTTFEFDTDSSDPAVESYVAPVVSGLVDSVWYDVPGAELNTLESMWYDSLPSRASLGDTVTGVDHELLTFPVSGISIEGEWEHHLGGGYLWIEAVSGVQYLQVEEDQLRRARVTLRGLSRQGLEEAETLVFPWPMRQRTLKEWDTIERVEVHDMDEDASIILTSANYNADDHISPWNLRYSDNRKKVDEFWGLEDAVSGTSLERLGYISDEWQQLVLGFYDKEMKESWELLDDNGDAVSGVDMALQPFTDRAWVVTEGGMLYCYNTDADVVSGVDLLRERTDGTYVQIDMDFKQVLLGEDMEFIPWFARPVQEILKYRMWYQTPSGTKYGLLDGAPVGYSTDFWVVDRKITRSIADFVSITAEERGEYLLVLEVEFSNGDVHEDRVLVSVSSKRPLTTIDLSTLVPTPIVGMEFDSDQKLWVKTADTYYQIDLHTDIMLIDYDQKIMYFKEPYEEVSVETNG